MAGIIKNSTRHKLKEAQYFLAEIESNLQDEDVFSYVLSAFLQAARSITFIMQKQYAKLNNFPEWYCKKQTEMLADQDLEYLNKARVDTVHKKIVPTGVEASARIAHGLNLVKAGEEPKVIEKPRIEMPKVAKPIRILGYFFMDHNDKNVVEFCEEQVRKLEKVVEECEAKFT